MAAPASDHIPNDAGTAAKESGLVQETMLSAPIYVVDANIHKQNDRPSGITCDVSAGEGNPFAARAAPAMLQVAQLRGPDATIPSPAGAPKQTRKKVTFQLRSEAEDHCSHHVDFNDAWASVHRVAREHPKTLAVECDRRSSCLVPPNGNNMNDKATRRDEQTEPPGIMGDKPLASAPPDMCVLFDSVPYEDNPSSITFYSTTVPPAHDQERQEEGAMHDARCLPSADSRMMQLKKQRKRLSATVALSCGVVGMAVGGPVVAILASGSSYAAVKAACKYRERRHVEKEIKKGIQYS